MSRASGERLTWQIEVLAIPQMFVLITASFGLAYAEGVSSVDLIAPMGFHITLNTSVSLALCHYISGALHIHNWSVELHAARPAQNSQIGTTSG